MPQSKRRENARGKVNRRTLDIIAQAQKLDRRRIAQIENQKASINRLLVNGEYGEEMRILHEAAAELVSRNDDLATALRDLVSAVDALPDSRAQGEPEAGVQLSHALAAARALVAVSAPVSESKASAG